MPICHWEELPSSDIEEGPPPHTHTHNIPHPYPGLGQGPQQRLTCSAQRVPCKQSSLIRTDRIVSIFISERLRAKGRMSAPGLHISGCRNSPEGLRP